MVGDPMSNPQAYNLNKRLLILTRELENDLRQIKADIKRISSALKHQ